MDLSNGINLNKKMEKLYRFRVFHMKMILHSGNFLRQLPIPVPRSGHRIVFFRGNVYAFGGYSPRDPDSDEIIADLDSRRLFRELWKFNIATKTWFQVSTSGNMPMELASHAALLVDSYMVVYGGTGLPFGQSSSNSTHLCSLKNYEWLTLSTSGEKPQRLYGQAIAVDGRKMYVVGGTTGFDYTICVHCLDLESKEWTRLDNKRKQELIPSSRYRHEIAIFEDNIFVFGGGTVSENFNLNEIPTFSLTKKSWSVSVTTTTSVFPEARRCHGLVQIGSDIYICGGYNGQTIYSDIWEINLKKLQWKKLVVELPIPLYFHSVTISPEGQLFSFGGVTDTDREIRTNAMYTVWLKIPSLSDICWEAVLSYIPNIGNIDRRKLYEHGVPMRYIQQIEFYTQRCKRKLETVPEAKRNDALLEVKI